MSDNQRRALCRILFLLVCFLPTVGVLYWICHPQTAGSWERAIHAELGIETHIDSIETPGLYVTILRGLEFSDPEVGSLLKTVEARIEFGDVNQIYIPYKVQNLTNKSLTCLLKNINRNLVRSQGVDKRWRISFEKDTLVEEAIAAELRSQVSFSGPANSGNQFDAVPGVALSNLQIDLGSGMEGADGAFVSARFNVAGASGELASDKYVGCRISKTDQYGHVIELNTNNVPLPCWLVADTVPFVPASLGGEATFAGELTLVPTVATNYLKLTGAFHNVDLGRSVLSNAGQFASIQLNQCRFENGELEDWNAMLFHDIDSPPRLISKESLFTFTKQVDVAQAIAHSILGPTTRLGELQVPRHLNE